MARGQWFFFAAAIAISLVSCGKKEQAPSSGSNTGLTPAKESSARQPDFHPDVDLSLPKAYSKWSPKAQDFWNHKISREQKGYWLEQESLDSLRKKQKDWVRHNYVRAAPEGFLPGKIKHRLKLTLVPAKVMIRKGEPFRYRLEFQNVGYASVSITELHSDFLLGNHVLGQRYRMEFISPGGKSWEKMMAAIIGKVMGAQHPASDAHDMKMPGAERMTQAQRSEWLRRRAAEDNIRNDLYVTLQPGEILVSKEWGGAAGSFNTLHSEDDWDKPGTYRIRAIFDDSPSGPPSQEEIQQISRKYGYSSDEQIKDYQRRAGEVLGLIESNVVSVEVTP
jgi:hypothetical protein